VYYTNNIVGTGQYVSYEWMLNGNSIPGATNQTYNYTQNGQYSIIVTDSNNCSNELFLSETCLNQDYFIVPVISQVNNMLSVPSVYAEYQWYLDDVMIPGAINQLFVFTQYGNYTVSIMDNAGCSDTSLAYLVDGVGFSTNENNKVSVYPNPVSSELTISNLYSKELIEIVIYDLNGRVCKRFNLIPNTINRYKVNMNDLKNGVYYISVDDSVVEDYIKIVKL